jgi:halocyanin-like protein
MRRRSLLLLTAGGVAALAGCSGGDQTEGTTSAEPTAEPTATATDTPSPTAEPTPTTEPTTTAESTPTTTAEPTTAEPTPTTEPTPSPTPTPSGPYDGWLDDVGNFDGSAADRTGQSTVRVQVGAAGNGGNFAFEPAAVRVDPGTTVRWAWTGNGGSHSVTASDGAFGSALVGAAGVNFEQTFDESGVQKYFCQPHRSLGMKGVVEVVE